jgi:hypothetical protein
VVPDTIDIQPVPVTERIRSVGQDLATTLRAVLEALPDTPRRPNQLSRALGVNRAIASRVLSATATQDPMEGIHVIPGPEPLRSVLQGAARKKVDPSLVEDAEDAIRRFEVLIRNDAGTRSALDAIISSILPSAREKLELSSKYSIFKGMSQLKGVQADTWLGTTVVTPSGDDPRRLDMTWLTGAFGIQRLRPDVTIRFSYRGLRDGGEGDPPSASNAFSAVPMEQFCVNPPALVEAHRAGNVINYTLPGDRLGPQFPTYAKLAPRNRTSLFVEPAFPVTELVFDTLLHEDVFPGSEPELVIYDTGTKGIANVNDPTRDIDRMDMQERIEFLPRDIDRLGCAEVPRYVEMLRHLCDRFGWDPAAYRGYRCRMQYPVYGWQISMSFEPPSAPDQA